MTKTIQKILVANRAEIAVRILRTARELGIRTVAVYSDADADLPHVHFADEAVHIGPSPALSSYLDVDRLLDAAKKTGADAIHPGYGFLSENAAFAEAVTKAGLVFIGPTPDAIRAMGKKREAKAIAIAAGVPVVPGDAGDTDDLGELVVRAERVGFPVLIKASAGGGGKGMRVARSRLELEDAIAAARREAKAAFGDDAVLFERYVDRPRHVEIQILGDAHGNLVHLFERECSIQRRHQKIIEETPSPALSPALRAEMGAAAVRLGKAIGYTNAGTVEFILAPTGEYYFLEVNTRLQVEHPVTEMTTGVDLVREQIRIAEGRPLSFTQGELRQVGHAIECRLYAEDPAHGFLPSTGRIHDFELPAVRGLRVDAGFRVGSEVSVHYDPMIAKLITTGATRAEALRLMRYVLERASVAGPKNNLALLARVVAHPAFLAGDTHTHFLDEHKATLLGGAEEAAARGRAALAAVLADHGRRRAAVSGALAAVRSGFRLHHAKPEWMELEHAGATLRVEYTVGRDGAFDVSLDGRRETVRRVEWAAPLCRYEAGDGRRLTHRVTFVEAQDHLKIHAAGPDGAFTFEAAPRFGGVGGAGHVEGLGAPMPGKVVQVRVRVGESVLKGQALVLLEAMKMEHVVSAPHDGVVRELFARVGEQVEADQILVVLDEGEAGSA